MTELDVACYYHQPDKLGLLADGALPAVRTARANGVDAHVERHWRHGPHLRVRLSGAADPVRAAAEATAATISAAVAAQPSRAGIDEAELLVQSQLLGRAELLPPPYEPIHPDNTVRAERPDVAGLARLIGGPAAVARRTELLRHGVPAIECAVDFLIAARNTSAARVDLALTAMAVHAGAYPHGLSSGYITFLSHVEDFLHETDPDGRIRARFETVWTRQRDRVVPLVRAAATDGGGPLGAAWSAWVRAAWAVCAPAYARGELPLLPGREYEQRAAAFGDARTAQRWDPRRTEVSDFHRGLRSFDYTNGVAAEFGPYRFMTNVLYQLLVVGGVTPLERQLAAYLCAAAGQVLAGESWQDAMTEHLAFLATTGGRP